MNRIDTHFKSIKRILFITFLLGLTFSIGSQAQNMPEPISKKEKEQIIDRIVANYSNWGKVTLTGKMSSPMLPVTATVKVYMEKDKLTLISVAAPLVGEAVRIEVDQKEVLIVNKMNKTYAKVSMADVERYYPGAQADLQNLFLGRITVMGKGAIGKRSADDLDIYDLGDERWMLVPNVKYQPDGGSYAYVVKDPAYELSQFIMVGETYKGEVNCYFNWNNGGMDMDFSASGEGMSLEGNISLNSPSWGGSSFGRIELNSKFKQTSIQNLLRF